MQRRRSVRVAVGLAVLGLLALPPGCGLRPDGRQQWQDDYDAMRSHLGATYSNLEWIAGHRRLDLYELDQRTTAALAGATSHFQGAAALEDFVAAFDDPHLRLEEPWYSGVSLWWRGMPWHGLASAEPGQGPSVGEACDRLGLDDEGMDFAVDLDELGEVTELPDPEGQPFPAVVVALGDGVTVGVIRIESFGMNCYLDCGRRAFERHGWDAPGRDATDGWAFFDDVCDEIVARLAERVRELKDRGVRALLIDLIDNGGGTDWVDPAARILTRRPLRAPRGTALRHPSEVVGLTECRERIAADLARDDLGAEDRALLDQARAVVDLLLEQVRQPVDRSPLFLEPDAVLARSLHAETPWSTTGVFDYLPPGSLAGLASRTDLFSTLRFDYEEGLWDGPLFVLMNRWTGSASEYFVAMLRDDEAATLIGERTAGAGFGYVRGGLPLTLPHCGWTLRVPNGSRYRRDGSNEIEGIEPDLAVDFEEDAELQDLRRFLLERLR